MANALPRALEYFGLVAGETAAILEEVMTKGTLGNVPWKLQPRPMYSTWNLCSAEAGYDPATGALNMSEPLLFFQKGTNAAGQGFNKLTIAETSMKNQLGGTNSTQIYIAFGLGWEIDNRYMAAGEQVLRYFANYVNRGDTNTVPLGLCRHWGTGGMGIQTPSVALGAAGATVLTAKNGRDGVVSSLPPMGEFLFMPNQQIQVAAQSGAPNNTIYLTSDGLQIDAGGTNRISEYRFTCHLQGLFLEQIQN